MNEKNDTLLAVAVVAGLLIYLHHKPVVKSRVQNPRSPSTGLITTQIPVLPSGEPDTFQPPINPADGPPNPSPNNPNPLEIYPQ
jgi:hypothetical protein